MVELMDKLLPPEKWDVYSYMVQKNNMYKQLKSLRKFVEGKFVA